MGPKTKWSYDDDLLLLRQVNAALPFKAKHGQVMDEWEKVAARLDGLDDFTRSDFDGKKAQNRFLFLLQKHQSAEKTSARASGINELYKEKRELLDSLSSLVHDFKQEEQAKTEEAKKKKDSDAAAGLLARNAAMESLGKRPASNSDRNSPEKKSKVDALIGFMAEQATDDELLKMQELEVRRLEIEERRLEREEARQEREADRNERQYLAQLERDKTVALINALTNGVVRQQEQGK